MKLAIIVILLIIVGTLVWQMMQKRTMIKKGRLAQAEMLGEIQVGGGGPMCQGDVAQEIRILVKLVEAPYTELYVRSFMRPTEFKTLQKGIVLPIIHDGREGILVPAYERQLRMKS